MIRKLRLIGRRVLKKAFGQDKIWSSRVLARLFAFEVQGQFVMDGNLEYPFVYEKNSVIGGLLFCKGGFEEQESAFVKQVLQHIDTPIILDIGANIGWHTISWAYSMPNVEIYAFEPSVTTSKILKKNIEMNRLDGRIFHIQNAVSDTIGTATFNECEDDAYSSLKDTKRKKVLSKIEVPVTTVDVFVNDRKIPAISLIKIDVEGMEHEVLHGAEKTLNLYSPDVFVEIYGGSSSNPDPELTVRYMLSLGYKAFVSDGKCFIPFEVHSDERFNYYFTKG